MPALAIDTATDVMAIALGEGAEIMAEISINAGRSHLELLLGEVHSLLGEQGATIRDIDAIVAGTGPGTFSGLRVGIATARALAQTLELPIAGFSTLEAQALELSGKIPDEKALMLLPLIDAKRGQVFAQLYKNEGKGTVAPESDVLCLHPVELLEKVAGMTRAKVRAGGNGALAHRDVFEAAEQLDLLPPEDPGNRMRATWHLRAVDHGAIYDQRQLLSVVPMYVREPDADKTVLLRKREPWLK